MAKLSSDHLFPFLSPQGGDSGEEQLCADLPELDLSQLDASDFDTATCFGELQWCPENSETEPTQYSPDDSELFQVSPDSLGPTQCCLLGLPPSVLAQANVYPSTRVLGFPFSSLDLCLA